MSTFKTASLSIPTGPKPGRATTRTGVGRNLRLGRKSDPEASAPPQKWISAKGPRSTGPPAAEPASAATDGKNGAHAKPFGSKAISSDAKKVGGYRKGIREPLPPRIITRPDRTKKDIIISPRGIERNIVRQVGQLGKDKKYHWVNTNEYDYGVYDLAADIKTMTKDERKAFWANNFVQVDLDVTYVEGVSEILENMDKLGKVFTENVNKIFINLIFPEEYDVEPRRKRLSVMAVPTIAALVPLVHKVASFQSLHRCVVTLCTPPGSSVRLWRDWLKWLDHAVPFLELPPSSWRLDWLPQGLKPDVLPEPVYGEHRHLLNVQWGKVQKEKALAEKALAEGMAALNVEEEK